MCNAITVGLNEKKQTFTTERYDVAAVSMHKFPRYRLLHNLFHLREKGTR